MDGYKEAMGEDILAGAIIKGFFPLIVYAN